MQVVVRIKPYSCGGLLVATPSLQNASRLIGISRNVLPGQASIPQLLGLALKTEQIDVAFGRVGPHQSRPSSQVQFKTPYFMAYAGW